MFKVRVITSTALISLAFLSLSTPGRAQDVFSGNDNAQQQNNDRGGFPTKRLPPIVNSFCPDEQPYYYNKDGYLMVKPGYSCGRRQGVENDVAPYDPDDCSKGAPGAYDPSQNPRCQTPYRRAARNPFRGQATALIIMARRASAGVCRVRINRRRFRRILRISPRALTRASSDISQDIIRRIGTYIPKRHRRLRMTGRSSELSPLQGTVLNRRFGRPGHCVMRTLGMKGA